MTKEEGEALLAQGQCPCGNTEWQGCSQTGCPLYLNSEEAARALLQESTQ